MSGLVVLQPGPRTTVQDLGRTGYQHQGLSPGGAADRRSFRWANHLLGNRPGDACLEVTLGGLAATADQHLLLAITGADCQATVNDRPVTHWGVFAMGPGDQLKLAAPRYGLLTYLGVYGGWRTREFLGSRSCVVREGLDGLGLVATNTVLPAEPTADILPARQMLRRRLPEGLRPDFSGAAPLKLMPGPERSEFQHTDLARFINAAYRISEQSDRMGYRLDGPELPSSGGVTSRGVCCGTVQIPGDGRPMVMLNDRQTIGGYPVLGTVPLLDCSRLAQKRPGDSVHFQWSSVADCQSERLLFERLLDTSHWGADGSLTCRWS